MVSHHYFAHEGRRPPDAPRAGARLRVLHRSHDGPLRRGPGRRPHGGGDPRGTWCRPGCSRPTTGRTSSTPACAKWASARAFANPDPVFYANYPSTVYTADFRPPGGGSRPAKPTHAGCRASGAGGGYVVVDTAAPLLRQALPPNAPCATTGSRRHDRRPAAARPKPSARSSCGACASWSSSVRGSVVWVGAVGRGADRRVSRSRACSAASSTHTTRARGADPAEGHRELVDSRAAVAGKLARLPGRSRPRRRGSRSSASAPATALIARLAAEKKANQAKARKLALERYLARRRARAGPLPGRPKAQRRAAREGAGEATQGGAPSTSPRSSAITSS